MQFKDKLFLARKKSGLTQAELAEKLNISRQAISKWEMGTAVPDVANMLSLSKTFNISIDYLANEEIENENDVPNVKATAAVFKINNRYIFGKLILSFFLILALLVLGLISRSFASVVIFTFIFGFIFLVYHGMRLLMLFFSNKSNDKK